MEMTSGGATVYARLVGKQLWFSEVVLTRVSWMAGDGFAHVLPHSHYFLVLLSPPVVFLGYYYPISNNSD